MCRNIHQLRSAERPATEDEIQLAALQFIRKVSGYRAPSKTNRQVFDQAVSQVAESVRILLEGLELPRSPGRSQPEAAGAPQ